VADRMSRTWLPFTTGQPLVALGTGASARVDIASILETTLGRQLGAFTITRMLLRVSMVVDSSFSVFQLGAIIHHLDVAVGVIGPGTDASSNWIWKDEVAVSNTGVSIQESVTADVRSQRKAQQSRQRLFLYVTNLGPTAGDFHVYGRALVLGA